LAGILVKPSGRGDKQSEVLLGQFGYKCTYRERTREGVVVRAGCGRKGSSALDMTGMLSNREMWAGTWERMRLEE
jgi:hypothetical protein